MLVVLLALSVYNSLEIIRIKEVANQGMIHSKDAARKAKVAIAVAEEAATHAENAYYEAMEASEHAFGNVCDYCPY